MTLLLLTLNLKISIKDVLLQSKSGYFDTGFLCPIVFFCRQVSVKIVLFVIQLENNRIYLSSDFFVYRVTLSFWQCNEWTK